MWNGLTTLSGDEYYRERVKNLKLHYQTVIPDEVDAQGMYDIIILACSGIAALLGAYQRPMSIPVVLAFAAMIKQVSSYQGGRGYLHTLNHSLAKLCEIEMEWDGNSDFYKSSPYEKQKLFERVEGLALQVVQVAVAGKGAVRMRTSGEDATPPSHNDSQGASNTQSATSATQVSVQT